MDGSIEKTRAASAGWALAGLALSMLLSSMGVSIANVALPTLASAFSAPFQHVQWVVLAYLLASTVTVVSAGRFGDMLGHRRMLLAGLGLFTAASILCGVAPSLPMLIGARAVQGIGAAILMALTIALVRETVTAERTGSAMGLLGTMSAVGTALGPSLGGVLLAGPGWRAIFLVMVPLGLLAGFLAYRFLPAGARAPNPGRKGFDGPGTILLALTLAAYALAMTVGKGHFDRTNITLLLLAGLGAAVFVYAEKKVASTLIRLALFHNPTLTAGLITSALVATVIMTTLVVGPFYLALALGLGEAVVGLVMSIGPVLSAFTGIPAGRVVDRLGAGRMVVVGLAAMATGSFALAVLPEMFGLVGYIAAIAVLTPGYQMFQAANNTAVMMDVEGDQRGVISGMLNLARNLGLITGASAMGAVFSIASGGGDVASAGPDAVASGMRLTFVVAGLLLVAALAIGAGLRAIATRVNAAD